MSHRIPFDINPETLKFFDLDDLIVKFNVTVEPQTEYDVLRPGAFFAYGKTHDIIKFVLAITGDRETDRVEYLAHLETFPAYRDTGNQVT